MPNSLKSKLSSLRYKRLITDEEYKELIKKLNGHDKGIRIKAIDEFAERLKKITENMFEQKYVDIRLIDEIAEEMKGGAEC